MSELNRHEELIRVGHEGVQDTPVVCALLCNLVVAYLKTSQPGCAIELWRSTRARLESHPNEDLMADLIGNLIFAYVTAGRLKEALRDLGSMIARYRNSNEPFFLANIAGLYAQVGKHSEALAFVEKALVAGKPAAYFDHDTDFDEIRNTRAFERLLNAHR